MRIYAVVPSAKRVLKDGLSQFPQDPDLLFYGAQVEWLDDENDAADHSINSPGISTGQTEV